MSHRLLSLPPPNIAPASSELGSPTRPSNHINMTSNPQAHYVLIPLMAQGHMIPMLNLACLLANRGSTVSFITTPVNAARMKPIIDNISESRLPIHFVSLPFPCVDGLPEGRENIDQLEADNFMPFLAAIYLLRDPLTVYLQNHHHAGPKCIISDYCHPWTMHVSQVLNIPRYIFHGPSCLYMLGYRNIMKYGIYDRVNDINQPFVVPDLLPYQLSVTRAQVPNFFGAPGLDEIQNAATEAEATSDGVVLNSFDELEPMFIQKYQAEMQKPVWAVGPLSLYNKDMTNKINRGKKASIDEHKLLGWLDSKEEKSVIYANFGSLVRTHAAQLIELGSGLEASGCPFIWVLKHVELTDKVNEWLEGFEVRTRKRGLVIKGWASQMVILSHISVGGFMTHCGWNSTLEAVSAGLPMLTWPHFADQFLNEKLVVEVLRIGITLGVTVPSIHMVEIDEVVVSRGTVKQAVTRLMDGGTEGKERRERAKELGEMASGTMEQAGSSYENLSGFMQSISMDKSRLIV